MLFDSLGRSVLIYGIKIWVWTEFEKGENQERFFKWTLERVKNKPMVVPGRKKKE